MVAYGTEENASGKKKYDTFGKIFIQEGIYTFKFDAGKIKYFFKNILLKGETNWFPKDYTLYSGDNPNSTNRFYFIIFKNVF